MRWIIHCAAGSEQDVAAVDPFAVQRHHDLALAQLVVSYVPRSQR